jgi:putative PEP-CTERM system histidine kinase
LTPAWWAGIAALTHALLGAYTLLAGAGILVRGRFLLVAGAGVLWGIALGLTGGVVTDGTAMPVFHGATLLLLLSWYLLLHRLLRGPYDQSMPDIVRQVLRMFWIFLLVLYGLLLWASRDGTLVLTPGVHALIALCPALICLSLAAELGGDAPLEGRTALRFLVGSAAVAAASLAWLLAVLTLTGKVALPILGLCCLGLAASALLALYAVHLRPQWSLAIFVSPGARSYAWNFAGSGVVLLLIILQLSFVRMVEPATAELLAGLTIVGAGVPLVVLLFSQQLNARLRVFVSKHFLPFRYDYREEWLRLIETLVSPGEGVPLPERAIRAVAQIVGSPAGVLWMRQSDGGPYTCVTSWNTRLWTDVLVPPDDPALAIMLERQWIVDTAELRRRPELYGGLQRPAWLDSFPEALLLVPLISNDTLIGFIVLLQSGSNFRLTFEDIDLLRTSGRQVAAFMAQYEADQKLAEARQFEAFNRLTAFVMHDLKNLIAQQSLMTKNAARHKDNPAFFEDAMATVSNSVARMQKLLQQLQSGETGSGLQRVRLSSALVDVLERCRGRDPQPRLLDDTGDLSIWIDRERFTQILTHLVRNAQEATPPDGRVEIRATRADGDALLVIEDTGTGMDQEFIRTRLFRPFDTTKGSKGMGIGAYQARTFVTEAGGTLRVESEPGQGTRVVIRLPVREPDSVDGN